MDNQKSNSKSMTADWTIAGIVIRLIASAVVLAITAFLVPDFAISGVGPLVIAAIVALNAVEKSTPLSATKEQIIATLKT